MSNETAKSEEARAITKAVNKLVEKLKKHNMKAVFAVAIAVLLVFGTAACGYYLWCEIGAINTKLGNRVDELQDRGASVAAEVQSLKGEYSKYLPQIRELQARNEALSTSLQQIYRQQEAGNTDYALSEIEYLLTIAAHRLILQKDVPTALAAMEAADKRLQGLDIPSVMVLREQLASDMNQLRSVNAIDITGLALYLADLLQRVEKLPLRDNIRAHSATGPAAGPAAEAGGWRHVVRLIWEELKSLVVISRDSDVSPVRLLPDEVYFLYQNLHVELANARLSVLNRDTENLQASVDIMADWLNSYFDTGDAAVGNILDTLQKMRSLELDPELPDISSSLETLRAYMHTRDEDSTASPGSNETGVE